MRVKIYESALLHNTRIGALRDIGLNGGVFLDINGISSSSWDEKQTVWRE